MDMGAKNYRRYLEGDDAGIVAIIDDYREGLILFLNRYVNNIHVAEELAEDTFVRIVTKRPRFAEKYSFKTWLFTIGRNMALNYLRHERFIVPTPIEKWDDRLGEEENLEHSYFREEQKIQVHRVLAEIREEYGIVLYLKFFEDLDNDQIGRILQKSKRQIENMLYQAKKALKAALEKEDFIYEEF